MFFKTAPDALEGEFMEAVKAAPPDTDALARAKAKTHAGNVRSKVAALSPSIPAFAAAAAVFIFLVVASYVVASAADAQTSTTATQLKDLSKGLSDLLVAWSGAVLGLVGGEAVGKKA